MKKRFPFRLGTTSYILRDDMLPNVHYLKNKVDHIEILLFETDTQSNYPSPEVVQQLVVIGEEHDLTYSVHLPLGIKLGSPDENRRKQDVAAVLRAIDAMRDLNPLCWDLHLEENTLGEKLDATWQDACIRSLEELKIGGAAPAHTGIETLEFGFEPIVPVLDATGFAVTLDIGHIWYCNFDETYYLEQILPRAVSFHLHGFNEERDHKSLHHIPTENLKRFIEAVAARPNAPELPVSIEIFSEHSLLASINVIQQLELIDE